MKQGNTPPPPAVRRAPWGRQVGVTVLSVPPSQLSAHRPSCWRPSLERWQMLSANLKTTAIEARL